MASNEPSAQSPSEYIPFNMDCRRCEYEPVCWLPLKVVNKITRRWIRFCRQGRKRKVMRQSTLDEVPKVDQQALVGSEIA